MWIRPATMLATAMRAGALASGSRVVLGANAAASRLVLAARPMATAAAKKSTSTTTRRAASAEKSASKKAAAKPKAKAVKKTPEKARKQPKSPEQQQAAKERAEKKKLIEAGLFTEPATEPTTPTRVFAKQWCAKPRTPGTTTKFREMHAAFKNLSPAELQEYEEIAAKNKLANEVAYKAWVQSHTPAQIKAANKARSRLARVFKMKSVKKTLLARGIKDHRIPIAPLTAYMIFVQSKMKAASVTSPTDARQNISEAASEWKNLSATERKVYEDIAQAEKVKYEKAKKEFDLSWN
ncbi:hypothetical protein PpBr36_00185 [Pyricularia pennisetigena]|uniref:hypothetical protein n=1 Tax=Pyricularia pennisetigena TaxID=1578925 RepID=UPI0011534C46|nr:hypothetical protein PpBr36_00185 [Pyricularia pennisetigena]TLS29470.1 hypothetical protein PpBr36_00185 [Pyricularia pennisetigena]